MQDEPTNEKKKEIIGQHIAALQEGLFSNQTMAGVWQKCGNAPAAEQCAKAAGENMKAIAFLSDELKALGCILLLCLLPSCASKPSPLQQSMGQQMANPAAFRTGAPSATPAFQAFFRP